MTRILCTLAIVALVAPCVRAADGDFLGLYTVNATSSASTNFISTSDVFADSAGNVYYVGSVQNTAASAATLDLNPGAGAFTVSVPANGYTQYAVKLNASNVFQWAVQYAAQDAGSPRMVAADSVGNVYIAGAFTGTQDFNPQAGTANMTAQGGADAYLLKLNSSGTFQWAVQWGNADQSNPGFSEYASGIGFDSSQNPVVCGRFTSTFDADPSGTTSNLAPAGSSDNIFLIGLNASGALQWSKAIGGSAVPRKMTFDSSGNLYIAGQFSSSTTDFNPDAGTTNLTHNGSADSFVAKYTGAGALVWAAGAGSSDDFEYAADVAVDLNGNVYATGRFRNSTDFDPSGGTFTLTHSSSGTNDIYVWKLTSTGGFGYAKAMQSTTAANEEGTAIGVDGGGNVLVGGSFQGTVDFDPGAGTQLTTGSGGVHIFLARLNSAGDYLWHGSIFSSGFSNNVAGIHLLRNGRAYAAGLYQGTPDFDVDAGTQTATSSGTTDGYVLSLDGLDEVIVTESGGNTAVTEGSPDDTYTVQLGFANTGNVTVGLTPSGQIGVGNGAGVAGSVTFTTAANDWSTPRTITVSALDDSVIEGAHAGTIAHAVTASADALFTGATGSTVNVGITDNDTAGVTVIAFGGTNVTEGGVGDSLSVSLTAIPSSAVTVTLSHSGTRTLLNGGTGNVSLVFAADLTALVPQTVTVAAVDDLFAEGPHTDAITFAVSSADLAFNGLTVSPVTVNITDDDTAGLSVVEPGGSTDVAEAGATDTVSLALTSVPSAQVTVTLGHSGTRTLLDGGTGDVNLVFAADNTALTPQTVNVAAVDDLIAEGAHSDSISFVASSADLLYDGLSVGAVTVNITDDDTAGLSVVETGGSADVAEGGATDSVSVALDSQPTGAVTVTLQPDGQLDLGAGAGTAVVLNFPSSAAALDPQTVTVTAANDGTLEGAHTGSISITTSSADPAYAGLSDNVAANIADDEVPSCDNPDGCAPFSGTALTVNVGDDVCLRVPDPALINSSYVWRRNGDVLVEGRFIGTDCRTLSIPVIAEDEGGTYTCEYDTGAKAPAVYTVEITVVPENTVPGPGMLSLAALAVALGTLGARKGSRKG